MGLDNDLYKEAGDLVTAVVLERSGELTIEQAAEMKIVVLTEIERVAREMREILIKE